METPTLNTAGAFFVLPFGGLEKQLKIEDAEGKPMLLVDADGVVKAVKENFQYQGIVKSLEGSLERERNKIRRLMKALSDEVTR